MDREDLRKTLSGVQADIELSTCLREHPSLDYQLSHYETSGVDCLVNLIRHTNDMLSELSMTERQEENPLLAYAWQAFFPRDVDEELTTHRFAVKRGVLEFLSTRIHSTLTFEQCCDSDLMNETKWSSDEWLLYESIRSGSSTEDRRREGGAASLIEYDCRQNPNWSLQDAVDRHLASKKEQSHLAMTRPVFVRVRYHSHADDPKPFGDIVTFHLPTTGGTAVTDDQVSRPFSLKAIVRMRDAIGERDYMRPYDHGGVVIDQFETKTLTPRDHSVCAKGGHSYTLAFVTGPVSTEECNEFLPIIPGQNPFTHILKEFEGNVDAGAVVRPPNATSLQNPHPRQTRPPPHTRHPPVQPRPASDPNQMVPGTRKKRQLEEQPSQSSQQQGHGRGRGQSSGDRGRGGRGQQKGRWGARAGR